MTKYQPGSSGERAQLLAFLTSPQTPDGPVAAVRLIRQWKRWLTRAREIQVTPPDCTLQARALELLTPKTGLSSTATFRIQTMKTQLLIDQAPLQGSVLQLAELLLAECESASIGDGSSDKKASLKKIEGGEREGQPSGGKADGKGKDQSKGKAGGGKGGKDLKPCVHWLKDQGCLYGKACRFAHDQEALKKAPDAKKRCFTCSGLGHFGDKCPTAHGKPREVPKADVAKKAREPSAGASGGSQPQPEPTSTSQAALLEETTKLLRSWQAKSLQATDTSAIKACLELQGGSDWGLLDSGATACLRSPFPDEDLDRYATKQVELAAGSTTLRVTPTGTLIGPAGTETIVAMGCLVQLGCRVAWRGERCTVIHPDRGSIAVTTVSGCPKVTREIALELIRDIEEHRLNHITHQVEARRLAETTVGMPCQKVLGQVVSVIQEGGQVELNHGFE